jgi:hypothetical protein
LQAKNNKTIFFNRGKEGMEKLGCYMDIDVVNTREGVRVITDLNNINFPSSKREAPYMLAMSLKINKGTHATFITEIQKHVGKVVRIHLDGHKTAVRVLREIDSDYIPQEREREPRNGKRR